MGSSFGGLNIGISSIIAQQRALDVTGHNISNINTPGYRRQNIYHSASKPDNRGLNGAGITLQSGTGVDVQAIRQSRDEYLERKLQKESTELGYWATRRDGIEELETIFNDNTEDGLQSVMDDFWNSWAQLAKPTGGLTARALVKESAIAFVETVKNTDELLVNFKKNKDTELKECVSRLNEVTKSIANLNTRIKKEESTGAAANDLRDERTTLINELSTMANIKVYEGETLNIALNGRLLVEDGNYETVSTVRDGNNDGYIKLTWSKDNSDLNVEGGSIKAITEMRDGTVQKYRDLLNELVVGVANEVNKVHSQGYGTTQDDPGNRNMFINKDDGSGVGININNIEYNPDLNNISNIAAAKTVNNFEDLTNAEALSQLRNKDIFSKSKYNDSAGSKYNFDDFYRNVITEIGTNGIEAKEIAEAKSTLVSQVENSIMSVSGVSLDEEMSNLIRFEHSYNAASRIVNAMDEMLDIIVNKVGLAGR